MKKYTLKAEISLKDATNKCYLHNKEHSCVAVDEKGNIEAKLSGKAEIILTVKEGGFKATSKVKVKNLELLPNIGFIRQKNSYYYKLILIFSI